MSKGTVDTAKVKTDINVQLSKMSAYSNPPLPCNVCRDLDTTLQAEEHGSSDKVRRMATLRVARQHGSTSLVASQSTVGAQGNGPRTARTADETRLRHVHATTPSTRLDCCQRAVGVGIVPILPGRRRQPLTRT